MRLNKLLRVLALQSCINLNDSQFFICYWYKFTLFAVCISIFALIFFLQPGRWPGFPRCSWPSKNLSSVLTKPTRLRNTENSRFFQRLPCREECELVISVIRLCPAPIRDAKLAAFHSFACYSCFERRIHPCSVLRFEV